MFKLYDPEGKEVTVYTSTDKREYIKSGHYTEKNPNKCEALPEKEEKIAEKKDNGFFSKSKPKKRKGF